MKTTENQTAGSRKYRAFVSYSHRDKKAGNRLFKQLDGYRTPKALAGAAGRFGPVPAKLYPLFRDREELATSHDLSDRIKAALADSDHLVVLCSPDAANSQWVNEEIRSFAAMGRADRIHPVIVAGRPPDVFPPALLAVSAEPLAADVTPAGDGWTDGPLKLVAGILGVGLGELKDREVARARRRARVNGAIAAVFALLAVGAGAAAWVAVQETRRAEVERARAEEAVVVLSQGLGAITDQLSEGAADGSVRTNVVTDLLASTNEIAERAFTLAPDSVPVRIGQGELLWEFAKHYRRTGDLSAAETAAARGQEIFDALAEEPRAAEAIPRMRSIMLAERAEVAINAGRFEEALDALEEVSAYFAARLEEEPDHPQWVADLAQSYDQIGTAQSNLGRHDAALEAFQKQLDYAKRLNALLPDDPRTSDRIGLAHSNLGDTYERQGALREAFEHYNESLNIAVERLGEDLANPQYLRDAWAALSRTANLRRKLGDLDKALPSLEMALSFSRRLLTFDPNDRAYRSGLAASHLMLADALLDAKRESEAVENLRQARQVQQGVVAEAPEDARAARSLAVIHAKLAQAGHDPAANWTAVADIAKALDARGQLSPADAWMIEDARTRAQEAEGGEGGAGGSDGTE